MSDTSPQADNDERLEVTSAVAVACGDNNETSDEEMGSLPVIDLATATEECYCEEASAIDRPGCSIASGDIESAEAFVQAPSGHDGNLTTEDLEAAPIAQLVTTMTSNTTSSKNENNSQGDAASDTSDTADELSLQNRRAEFISATVVKPTTETPIGMELVNNDGDVHISSITPNTLMDHTPFQVGDRLLSVNTKRCYIMDAKDVLQFMASLEAGPVTIVVHNPNGDPNLVESMIQKPAKDSRCGLGLVSAGRRKLKISGVDADGLFYDSLLNVGDPIVSINGEDCEFADAQDAGDMIARAGLFVTIKAKTLLETGVVVAAFSSNNSTGSTIPPQVISALNRSRQEPSTHVVVALAIAVLVLISLILITGLLN